jgi:murein DD-endopeptidase MepM/ murein hydrolase activator NlpD
MTHFKTILSALSLVILFGGSSTALWAAPPPIEPDAVVYTVQPGDTLLLIALRFNLNPAEISLANDLPNPNLIFPGQELVLPGLELPPIAAETSLLDSGVTHIIQPGETIYYIANWYGVTPANLIAFNNLTDPNLIQIGQPLQIPQEPLPTSRPLQPPFAAVGLSEPTINQGRVLVVRVRLAQPATLTGMFDGRPFIFYSEDGYQQWGLVAIHALQQPTTYPITIKATLPNKLEITQIIEVVVSEGPYSSENINIEDDRADLLNADLIRLEHEKMLNIWSQVTLRPRWEGPFWYPVATDELYITSNFGIRRHYNNSEQLSFHAGADFRGVVGAPIYAPAAGVVVLAEPLTVRGNAVVIDHGLGLYSGYWHQSRIAVTEGQEVQPGDLIGYIGDTGLVTGPHLHWEMRLNGIAVEPLQWIQQAIP